MSPCGWSIRVLTAVVLLSLAASASGQVPRTAGLGLRRESEIPAPRLMFYSLMLGEQPEGVLTWYGMVDPLLRQQRLQAERQQQIEELQSRLTKLRAAQAREAQLRAAPRVSPQPTTGPVLPGSVRPARRPAAGFQRYGAPTP